MTQAAVSYQIKVLEDRLGGPLFLRGARGVSLTEAGRRIAPAVADAFGQLRMAFESLQADGGGVLAITAVNTFATYWLVPRLGEFQLAHPGIAVRLDTSPNYVDFAREDVDVGIRAGAGDWPGLAKHLLMPITYTPMLSPRLLAKAGGLDRPEDLLKLPLIDPQDTWWGDWFTAAGLPAPDLSRCTEMQVQTQYLAGSAALAGQGVAILTPRFFAGQLAAGSLVQPFPLVRQSPDNYWLVYPEARRRSAKIRAFRDWLLAAIGPEAEDSF